MSFPFELKLIKKIHLKRNGINSFQLYEIFFDDNSKLISSELHAFLNSNNTPLKASELHGGDIIWVDTYAFTKDKSYRVLTDKGMSRITKTNKDV